MKINKDILYGLLPKWWSVVMWLCIGIIICGNTLTGETRPSIKRVIKQTAGDTLTFKVNGLVCSFCAHGLNKGIGKMDYTDEKGILVGDVVNNFGTTICENGDGDWNYNTDGLGKVTWLNIFTSW